MLYGNLNICGEKYVNWNSVQSLVSSVVEHLVKNIEFLIFLKRMRLFDIRLG